MATYIPFYEGRLYLPKHDVNTRGFYENELQDIEKNIGLTFDGKICIEDEVIKYRLLHSNNNDLGLEKEVYLYRLWYEAYNDKMLNNFSIPIRVKKSNEYMEKLKITLKSYVKYLRRPAFVYEKDFCDFIEEECNKILEVLNCLISGKSDKAEKILLKILEAIKEDTFLVNKLNMTYSFRSVAPFFALHSNGYDKLYNNMMQKELTFFRARTIEKDKKCEIKERKDILHLPYNQRKKAKSMRFSVEKSPALYLSVNTYVCAQESNWNPEKENLVASVFIPNEQGKKFKILNLTISQSLINGAYNPRIDFGDEIKQKMQLSMLKIFPIVIATSFSVEEDDQDIKYHYLLSQALMKAVSKIGIDGIAYFSMRGDNEFQFPQGVNLVVLADDISKNRQYSIRCEGFEVSQPKCYCERKKTMVKSYINEIFQKTDINGMESFTGRLNVDGEIKYYGETTYAEFDNYLTSLLEKNN